MFVCIYAVCVFGEELIIMFSAWRSKVYSSLRGLLWILARAPNSLRFTSFKFLLSATWNAPLLENSSQQSGNSTSRWLTCTFSLSERKTEPNNPLEKNRGWLLRCRKLPCGLERRVSSEGKRKVKVWGWGRRWPADGGVGTKGEEGQDGSVIEQKRRVKEESRQDVKVADERKWRRRKRRRRLGKSLRLH